MQTLDMLPLETAFIGLGSNLDDPVKQVRRALMELDLIPETQCVRKSGLYRNPPMGPQDQPDYVNAVAMVHTRLQPEALLDALLEIERLHGRVRGEQRWGPRTLDLDLLLYGQRVIVSPRLLVPHPGVAERTFVLYPLHEICADLNVPGFGALGELIARYPDSGLVRMDDAS